VPACPRLPPVILKVVDLPKQMVVEDAFAELAGIAVSLTIMLMLLHIVFVQLSSALAK
jgi:hypothetical protein